MNLAGLTGWNNLDITEDGTVNMWVLDTWARASKEEQRDRYFPLPHKYLINIHIELAQMDVFHQEIVKTISAHGPALQLQLLLHQIRVATFAIERATRNHYNSFVRFLLVPQEFQNLIWKRAGVSVSIHHVLAVPNKDGIIEILHYRRSLAAFKFWLQKLSLDPPRPQPCEKQTLRCKIVLLKVIMKNTLMIIMSSLSDTGKDILGFLQRLYPMQ